MCYEVKCLTCGKITWGGCGRHVPSVYKRIEEAQRCLCKEWPGINLITNAGSSNSNSKSPNPTNDGSVCTIL